MLKKYKKRTNSVNNGFHPKINPHSKFILEEKSFNSLERDTSRINKSLAGSFTCRNKSSFNFQDPNTSKERLADKTRDEYIRIKQQLYKTECTFKPHLNNRSREIASNSSNRSGSGKRTNDAIYDRLYQDAKDHQHRLEHYSRSQLKKNYPFKPSVLNTSRSTKAKDFDKYRKQYLKKVLKTKEPGMRSVANLDKLKNTTSFVPHGNKSRSGTRSRSRSNNKSVYDELYNDAKNRQLGKMSGVYRKILMDRKKHFSKYLNKKPVHTPGAVKRSKSKKIINTVRKQRCKELFSKLDDDNDGYISAHKIDILNVDNKIIDLITPILLKIEKRALILNFEQFCETLEEFAKKLTVEERNLLFGPTKTISHNHEEPNTFRPRLNSKSMQI